MEEETMQSPTEDVAAPEEVNGDVENTGTDQAPQEESPMTGDASVEDAQSEPVDEDAPTE